VKGQQPAQGHAAGAGPGAQEATCRGQWRSPLGHSHNINKGLRTGKKVGPSEVNHSAEMPRAERQGRGLGLRSVPSMQSH